MICFLGIFLSVLLRRNSQLQDCGFSPCLLRLIKLILDSGFVPIFRNKALLEWCISIRNLRSWTCFLFVTFTTETNQYLVKQTKRKKEQQNKTPQHLYVQRIIVSRYTGHPRSKWANAGQPAVNSFPLLFESDHDQHARPQPTANTKSEIKQLQITHNLRNNSYIPS